MRNRVENIVAAALIFALFGCDGGGSSGLIAAQPLKWQKLSDGSRLATREHGAEDRSFWFSDVYRCWPKSGKYDCLYVSENTLTGLSAWRHASSVLPTGDEPSSHGYGCNRTKDYGFEEETITGPKGKLISNMVGGLDPHPPWSAEFVRSYMAANGLSGGDPHFACAEILRLYTDGSMATFETNSVSYARHMR